MKVKKSAAKRYNWPPRLTPKRKRSLALLQQWAAADIVVEYTVGTGVFITGTLSQLPNDDRGTDFLFRNDFGVHAVIFTDLYEDTELTEIPGLAPTVHFTRKDDHSRETFGLKPKPKRPMHEEHLLEVYDIFRIWSRLKTKLVVHVGDALLLTMSTSTVTELSAGMFMFWVADTEIKHIVDPAESGAILLSKSSNRNVVSLVNLRSGTRFSVTDGVENAEEVISRFKILTTKLQ